VSKDNRRLGRGLEALLGKVAAAQPDATDVEASLDSYEVGETEAPKVLSPAPVAQTSLDAPNERRSVGARLEAEKDRALAKFSDGRVASEIAIDKIVRNPFQPRLDFDVDEMAELKNSLSQHGMLQPVVLRQKDEKYELVAGERRFRAAKELRWKTVPALLLVVEDRQMAELALTENMQRRDLNPIEKATAFRNYLDEYGGTHDELANRLALDRSTVTNLMRLLDLHEDVRQMTRRGEITMGHARALLPLEEWDQVEMAKRIVEESLSVRQTEAIVKEFLDGADSGVASSITKPTKGKPEVSPRIRDLEQQFRSWLGMKINLTSNDRGKGKLVVHFNSNDEFERVYQALKPRDM